MGRIRRKGGGAPAPDVPEAVEAEGFKLGPEQNVFQGADAAAAALARTTYAIGNVEWLREYKDDRFKYNVLVPADTSVVTAYVFDSDTSTTPATVFDATIVKPASAGATPLSNNRVRIPYTTTAARQAFIAAWRVVAADITKNWWLRTNEGDILISDAIPQGGGGGRVQLTLEGNNISQAHTTWDIVESTRTIAWDEVRGLAHVGGQTEAEVTAAIAAAITALKGGVATNRDTLQKLSAAIDAVPSSGGGGGLSQAQVQALITTAVNNLIGSASSDGDTLGELEDLIVNNTSLATGANIAAGRAETLANRILAIMRLGAFISSDIGSASLTRTNGNTIEVTGVPDSTAGVSNARTLLENAKHVWVHDVRTSVQVTAHATAGAFRLTFGIDNIVPEAGTLVVRFDALDLLRQSIPASGGGTARPWGQIKVFTKKTPNTGEPADGEFVRTSGTDIRLGWPPGTSNYDIEQLRGARRVYNRNSGLTVSRWTEIQVSGQTIGLRMELSSGSIPAGADSIDLRWNARLLAEEISVASSGFDGNLATSDNTVQKVAQAVDDLTLSGGGLTAQAARNLIADWAEQGDTSDVPIGKIPAGIARDTEVASAVAGLQNQSQVNALIAAWWTALASIPDGKIPSGIARDTEVATAVAGLQNATQVNALIAAWWAALTAIPDGKIPSGIARDTEVTAAVNSGVGTSVANISIVGTTMTVTRRNGTTFTRTLPAGGTAPTPTTETLRYGVIASSADTEAEIAALFSSLTSESADIAGHDITLGPTTAANQQFVLVAPADHDLLTLVNKVTNADERATYTRIVWTNQVGSVSYISYHSGVLRQGVSINYRVTLAE